jgi:very-short-patch-repair endonuclease
MVQFKEIIKARYFRKTETQTEKIFWERIRNNRLGVKFRRQHPIGVFIIDFYAPKIKLAIELDGFSHKTKDGKKYDEIRTEFLNTKDIKVLRFWNNEIVNNLENVINQIKETIKQHNG